MRDACEALGLNPTTFEKALCYREIRGRNSIVMKPLVAAQAADQRDTVAKAVYGHLFAWLVGCVTETLTASRAGGGAADAAPDSHIGILDIFGFEIFGRTRSSSCASTTRTRLQFHFNDCVFRQEMDGYRAEGVPVDDIAFRDNSACVSLIEAGKGVGILMKLDEELKRPKATDETFGERLVKDYAQPRDAADPSSYFKRERLWKSTHFAIAHFAGDVRYDAEGWLEKNRDKLSTRTQSRRSTPASRDCALPARHGTTVVIAGERPDGKGDVTIGARFKGELRELMTSPARRGQLRGASSRTRQGRVFEGSLVMHQLRCAGLEAIRIRKAGYAFRQPLEGSCGCTRSPCPASRASRHRRRGARRRAGGPRRAAPRGVAGACGRARRARSAGHTKVFMRSAREQAALGRGCAQPLARYVMLAQVFFRGCQERLRCHAVRRRLIRKQKEKEERERLGPRSGRAAAAAEREAAGLSAAPPREACSSALGSTRSWRAKQRLRALQAREAARGAARRALKMVVAPPRAPPARRARRARQDALHCQAARPRALDRRGRAQGRCWATTRADR